MRKLFFSLTLIITSIAASAQDNDSYMFNHLGAGVGIGTQGITIDAATMCTPYIGIRAGVNIMPSFSYRGKLHVGLTSPSNGEIDESEYKLKDFDIPLYVYAKGALSMTTGHLLFDFYPGKTSIFHLTVGAYFGGRDVVNAYNEEDGALMGVYRWNSLQTYAGNKIVAELGDYILEPNSHGNVDACFKVFAVRPYVGIGFGRVMPKSRIGFQFDLGVQFWGHPEAYCNGEEAWSSSSDNGYTIDIMQIISALDVYPVLSFRLCTRII